MNQNIKGMENSVCIEQVDSVFNYSWGYKVAAVDFLFIYLKHKIESAS